MSFVPIVDPQHDIVGQTDDFDAPPRTPRLTGLLNETTSILQESPVGWAAHTIAKYAHDQVDPGKFLPPEMIKQKYPNILKKYPQGGHEYDVMLDSELKASHDAAIDTVANMPKGFMSTATRWGGALIGTALSPTSWLGLGAATKATRFAAKALVGSAITKRLLGRLAVRFGFRTAEGLGAIAPLTAGEQNFYKQMDEKAPPIWTNLILGGLMAGTLGTAFGSRVMFEPKIMSQALETANDQMATGKNINVEPLLKQAQYEASKTWPETQEEIQAKIDELKAKQATLPEAQQKEMQKTIDETELYQEVHASKPEAPTKEELNAAVKPMTSWETNQDTNMEHFNNAEDLVKKPEDPIDKRIADLDETIGNLRDNNLLTDDAKGVLEEGEAEQKTHISVTNALRQFGNCVLKGGE